MFSQIDALNFRGSVEAVKERLRPIFRKAQQTGAFVNLDLEQFRYRDLTFVVFKELLEEDEFAGYDEAGVVVQAYLRDAEHDIRGLIDWARERDRVITVRLVKGAYWDYETVQAAQEGWPAPVFTHKPDSDVMYERITRIMLEHPGQIRSAFASHNVRSLAHAIATAEALGLPKNAYELQMLHGMGEPIKAAIRTARPAAARVRARRRAHPRHGLLRAAAAREHGQRVVPAARRSPRARTRSGWCARRSPHQTSTARRSACPCGRPPTWSSPGPFVNQPHADFSRPENVAAFAAALERVSSGVAAAGLGKHWPLWIGGEAVETDETLTSVDPARPQRSSARLPTPARRRRSRRWPPRARPSRPGAPPPPAERAALLFRAAELMRGELFELAALEVFEAGKTWREADADVGEAIDFLEYYGREILRLEAEGQLADEGDRPRARTPCGRSASPSSSPPGTSPWRSSRG